jgi:hypothetical protein
MADGSSLTTKQGRILKSTSFNANQVIIFNLQFTIKGLF